MEKEGEGRAKEGEGTRISNLMMYLKASEKQEQATPAHSR